MKKYIPISITIVVAILCLRWIVNYIGYASNLKGLYVDLGINLPFFGKALLSISTFIHENIATINVLFLIMATLSAIYLIYISLNKHTPIVKSIKQAAIISITVLAVTLLCIYLIWSVLWAPFIANVKAIS